jgi:hypothetical protein
VGVEMGEYVLFGAAMGGIVTDHYNVGPTLGRRLTGELSVVTGQADRPHFAFLAKANQFLADMIGELLAFVNTQKQEDVDVVGAQLPEAFFQRSPQIRVTDEQVVGAGGDDYLLALGGREIADGSGKLGVETVTEEVIDAALEGPLHDLTPGSIGCRQTQAVNLKAGAAQTSVGEVADHSRTNNLL